MVPPWFVVHKPLHRAPGTSSLLCPVRRASFTLSPRRVKPSISAKSAARRPFAVHSIGRPIGLRLRFGKYHADTAAATYTSSRIFIYGNMKFDWKGLASSTNSTTLKPIIQPIPGDQFRKHRDHKTVESFVFRTWRATPRVWAFRNSQISPSVSALV
jgi:hypothetical protein